MWIVSKPIRRDLLIHNVIYKPLKQKDSWGHSSNEEVLVNRVRIEIVNKLIQSATGNSLKSETLMFWDRVHSSPCEFEEEGKIIHDGVEMTIIEIRKKFAKNSLHHLELRLI